MASAPYARRSFPGGAVITTVPLGIGQFDGSCVLYSADNWTATTGNFFVTVDYAMPTEEEIECSSISGTTVNFADRGSQGTTAVEHEAGCTIFVSHVPRDDDEANQVAAQTLGTIEATGDLLYAETIATNANTMERLPIGSSGQVLTVTGGVPAWANAGSATVTAASVEATFTAKGQLYAGTGSGTGELLAKGSSGQVLTVGGSDSSGLEWTSILVPTAQTTTYSANAGDLVQANASSGAFTVTIPITDGAITAVKKMDSTNANPVTISPASGTIDGAAHLKLYGQYAGYVFVGDGTNANVVATTSSVWQAYTPSWEGASTNPAIGNGSITARFQQCGQTISVKVEVLAGSTTTFGSGQWWVTLPSSAQGGGSLTNLFGSASAGSTYYLCQAVGEGNSSIVGLQVATTGAQVTSSAPATQTSSSYFSFSGSYETL